MADLATIGFKADASGLVALNRGLDTLDSKTNRTEKSMAGLTKTTDMLRTALVSLGAVAAVGAYVKLTDTWTDLNSRLVNVTGSVDEANKALKSISDTADRTYSSLTDTAEAFLANAQTLTELGYSTEKQLVLSEALNNALVISGTKGQAAASVMDALSKSFATGKLSGENFNSVIARGGRVVEALADGLGVSTLKLREMATAGELTTGRVFEALTSQAGKLAKESDAMAATVGDGFVRINNAIQTAVGRFDELTGASADAAGVLVGISEAIKGLDDDTLQRLADGILLVGKVAVAVFGARMISALVASSSALALNAAMALSTKVTYDAMGMAITRTTGLMNASAVAARGLSAAMALVGGPIGVAVLAALALYQFASASDEAEKRAAGLAKETDELVKKFAELNEEGRKITMQKLAQEASEYRLELIKATAELERMQKAQAKAANSGGLGGISQAVGVARAEGAVAELERKLNELAETQAKLFESTMVDNWKKLDESVTAAGTGASEASKNFEKLHAALVDQVVQLTLGKEAYEEWHLLQQLGIDATEDEKTALLALLKVRQQLTAQLDAEKAVRGELDELMKGDLFGFGEIDRKDIDQLTEAVNNFGGAWTEAGSAMINAFGGVAEVFDDIGKRMENIDKLQSELNEQREKYALDSQKMAELDILQLQLNDQNTRAQLNGLSKVAGATSKLFKEESKERKALHNAQKAFAAVEIALSLQKASANALTAISSAFSAPWPVGFASGAAMIGIMAGLGLFSGGSSGGGYSVPDAQAAQSSGSLLGSDEQSQSITNSLDAYQDIAIDQLAELRGIRSSMTNLSNGIAQLAVSLVGSGDFGGGNVSGLGTSKQFQLGSGLASVAALGVFAPLDKLLGGLMGGIVNTVMGGISKTSKKLIDSGIAFDSQSLGDIFSGGFEAVYYNVIETTKKKLWGLSKKTSTGEENSAIDSAILDNFTNIFSYIGETVTGSLEVLGIDAVNALDSFQLTIGKMSFEGMSGEEIQKELEAIFSKQADLIAAHVLPSLQQWQQMGEGMFETLTRVAREQAVFNDTLDNLGLNLGDLSSIMRVDVAQAIITMMGGLEEFSDATGVYFDKFFSDTEKFTALSNSVSDAFNSIGLAMPETSEGFRALVESLDLTTEAGQAMFAALMQLSPAFAAYLDGIEKGSKAASAAIDKEQKEKENAARSAFGMLQRAISAEKQLAQARLDGATDAYNAEKSRVSALQAAAEKQHGVLTGNLETAEGAIRASFDAEIGAISAAAAARVGALNTEMQAVQQMQSLAQSVVNSMRSAAGISVTVEQALAAARRGDLSLAAELQVGTIGSESFSSAADMRRAAGVQSNQLLEISNIAGGKLSDADRQISAINQQIEATNKAAESQIEALKEQLNALLGIDDSVLPLEDAIKQFKEAQLALDEFGYEEQMSIYEQMLQSNEDVYQLHKDAYQQEIDRLDGILSDGEAQLNALLGIDNSVMSVADAVDALAAAIAAANERQVQTVKDDSEKKEQLHKEEIKEMQTNMNYALESVAKHSAATAKILQRMEMDGLDVRSVL